MPDKLQFTFLDNNGKAAQSQVWLPDGFTVAAAGQFALAAASLMEPLTDAYLTKVSFVRHYDVTPTPHPATNTADIFSRLCLFFRNGDDWSFIRIPAAAAGLPYDLAGAYAGRRLTGDSILASNRFTSMLELLSEAVNPVGAPYGIPVVGARTKGGQ